MNNFERDELYPRDTAIIHRSELESIKNLLKISPESAGKLAISIFDYKLDGRYDKGSDGIVDSNMNTIMVLTDAEAKRWIKNGIDGAKGGRPKERVTPSEVHQYCRIEKHSQQAAADHFGFKSVKTIQRRLKEYDQMTQEEIKIEMEKLDKMEKSLSDEKIGETPQPQKFQYGEFIF